MFLNHIDEATCASDMAKKISVMYAIMWLKSARDAVNLATIEKCFVKCGFVDTVVDTIEGEDADCLTSHVGYLLGRKWHDMAGSLLTVMRSLLHVQQLRKTGKQIY